MGDQALPVIQRTANRVAAWAINGTHSPAEAQQEVKRRVEQAVQQSQTRTESAVSRKIPVTTRPSLPFQFRVDKPKLGRVHDTTVEHYERTYLHGYYGARRPGLGPVGRMSNFAHPSKALTCRRRLELAFTLPENSKFFAMADPISMPAALTYACLTETAVTTAFPGADIANFYPLYIVVGASGANPSLRWSNQLNALQWIDMSLSVVSDTVLPPVVEGAAFSPLGGSLAATVCTPQGSGAEWTINGPDTLPGLIDRCGTMRAITSSTEGTMEAPTLIGTASLVNPATTTSDLVLHVGNVGSYGGYVENQAALSKRWAVQLMDPANVNWLRVIGNNTYPSLAQYYNSAYFQQSNRALALGAAQFYAIANEGTVISLDFAYDYAIATGEASPLRALRSICAQIPPGNLESRVNAGMAGYGSDFKEAFRNAVTASRASAIANGGVVAKLINPDSVVSNVEYATAPGLINCMRD